ncbi:hypothetical protein BN946_scf185022.g3 [Trametes cinnabarina]|uniref:C2H2-type domain-containing protein n=1 Tax=Pycnoporus cinnabarinus TaxID=5643 RepID=A0A060SQZ0_PYCCI|nr:hypothetical protein BN946_scf185022.g3 [Trametes cinnabarina]
MPVHNAPRNIDTTPEEPWPGLPVMSERDKPVSFIMRGAFARRASPDAPDRGDREERAVEPRGLPAARYKTPPRRTYYFKRPVYTEDDFHPLELYNFMDERPEKWVRSNGQSYLLNPPSEPELRITPPKGELPEPIPGVMKPARGRQVPTAGNSTDPRRKYVCPVETCRKAFTKRFHVARHIKTLHRHETTSRRDHHRRHSEIHSHHRDIFACAPENDFKGIQLLNPQTVHPSSANIKPYKAMAIPPLALSLWLFQERQRREEGLDIPRSETSDVERYFRAHPEEVEAALREDPDWDWQMPQYGPEFVPIEGRFLVGTFKLDVRRATES